MKEFVRGEIIQFFDWQFRDIDKEVTVPEAALLRIVFPGCKKPAEIPLVREGSSWSAEWDSSEADGGTVYFFIESVSPKVAVAEGEFRLRANPANPRR
jgi:hypothetical protein